MPKTDYIQKTGQSADADYFDYDLQCMNLVQNAAVQWTAWKNLTREGGTPPPTGGPVLPVLPTAVTPVAPGVEARFRALVQSIKTNAAYNEAMGDALGIEGSQQVGPDLTTLQPVINAVISGSHVNVKWGWGGNVNYLDMCEIQVDRGDGKGYVLLTYDTTPGYYDTAPFPATPTKWTYKAIYRVDDMQVGLWSNPVTLTVGG
jgi:hypothetical protein